MVLMSDSGRLTVGRIQVGGRRLDLRKLLASENVQCCDVCLGVAVLARLGRRNVDHLTKTHTSRASTAGQLVAGEIRALALQGWPLMTTNVPFLISPARMGVQSAAPESAASNSSSSDICVVRTYTRIVRKIGDDFNHAGERSAPRILKVQHVLHSVVSFKQMRSHNCMPVWRNQVNSLELQSRRFASRCADAGKQALSACVK